MEARDIVKTVEEIFLPQDRDFAILFIEKYRQIPDIFMQKKHQRFTARQFYFLLKFFLVYGYLFVDGVPAASPCNSNTFNDCIDNFVKTNASSDIPVSRESLVHWRNVFLSNYFGQHFEAGLEEKKEKKILIGYERLFPVLKFMAIHGKCISRILS